jgi:nicotinamidase-related amidase
MELASALLLVVDMQKGHIKPEVEHIVPRVKDFIERWNVPGGKVVFTCYKNYPGSPCEKFLDWHRMYGPPETDIHPELRPFAYHTVEKTFYTALTPELQTFIKSNDISTLLLCGTDTAACVMKTALDAFDAGIRPLILSDLCASGDGEVTHQAALTALRRAIGAEQVVESMTYEKILSK